LFSSWLWLWLAAAESPCPVLVSKSQPVACHAMQRHQPNYGSPLPSTRDLTDTPAQDDTAGAAQSVLLLQDQQ
jgi:hypothetical protein